MFDFCTQTLIRFFCFLFFILFYFILFFVVVVVVLFAAKYEIYSCTQAAICCFCSQIRNLQLYSNSHSFSHGKIQNSFFFYHETRNLNCTQNGNCFLTTTYKMFPIRHLLFEKESKNLKFYPNGCSFFDHEYKI